VIAARRNNNNSKTPTHSAYRSKSYQDARAEQDLRNQLKVEIDPDQPINFESYGSNRLILIKLLVVSSMYINH